ncbi:MAG: dephospho-CoA kinase [Hungatella sp.]|nr:dephospho-CoA kinase [Hungatella sp.]
MMPNRTKVVKPKRFIALTGGVGSGKSRILETLKENFPAAILQTDLVAKDLEEPGQPGFEALKKAFGEEIVDDTGRLRKEAMVRLVFGDYKTREKINVLIHPLVWEFVKQWCRRTEEPVAVVESALLPENPHDFFTEVWYVHTSRENRIQRLMDSRGYSIERCIQMIEGQPSEEEYRRQADCVIDNNGTEEEIYGQIRKIMER